jgi:hypothetical protein
MQAEPNRTKRGTIKKISKILNQGFEKFSVVDNEKTNKDQMI